MPHGWYGLICCICFESLTKDTCAMDPNGILWDACRGDCAHDAGVVEYQYA